MGGGLSRLRASRYELLRRHAYAKAVSSSCISCPECHSCVGLGVCTSHLVIHKSGDEVTAQASLLACQRPATHSYLQHIVVC